jgi:hypothetical protein
MLPHRSHRRLRPTRRSFIILLVFVAALEGLLFAFLPAVMRAGVTLDANLLQALGQTAPVLYDDFLHLDGIVIGVALPPVDYRTLTVLVAAGASLIAAVSMIRRLPLPIRYGINLHLILLTAAAVYLLIGTVPGYDGTEFSALMVHTALLTIPVLALFAAALGVLFPLTLPEAIGFVMAALAYDLLLSLLRYAVFLIVAAHLGAIVLPVLYLLYGPLLDILPIGMMFMVLLTRVSARLQRSPEVWQWM